MTLSILHRVTGVGLSVGFAVWAAWLFGAMLGAEAYAGVIAMLGTVVGKVRLIGWSFAVFLHLSNGIRHLVWDMGRGVGIGQADASAWVVLLTSLVWSGLFWWLQS